MAKVYLDHLIPRDNFRYVDKNRQGLMEDTYKQSDIRLSDIAVDWFTRLRKPDFQRETNSWSPEGCVALLKSILNGDVVPGIIVWKSNESTLIYVIDGAHRLSVLRAWMLDDWGDKNIAYYNELHKAEIVSAAEQVRQIVNSEVGSYEDFKSFHQQLRHLVNESKAPRKEMSSWAFQRANFYSSITDGLTLVTQWVKGTYQEAERSFLQINRSGERLGSFEQMLIEHRNGPYGRVVSSIVSSGRSGHFWPEGEIEEELNIYVDEFPKYAESIHNILFRPPYNGEILDFNQPLVISKPSDRYEDGLELVALISENLLLSTDELKLELLSKHCTSGTRTIITQANEIFRVVLDRLSQLIGENTNPKSLGIVPLIYTYNHQGVYSRNLLYAFVYWLFSGTDQEIRDRKILYSSVRERFERILTTFKSQITSVASRKGGTFKSTKDISQTLNTTLTILVGNRDKSYPAVSELIKKEFDFTPPKSDAHPGRTIRKSQKNKVNINSLVESSVRCAICGGLIDLRQGKQYDHHFEKYSKVKITESANMKPTHPFCNNMRDKIEALQKSNSSAKLPKFVPGEAPQHTNQRQLTLF
ncbi:DUF262 domain-containing protein [Hahella aquimaris]|uniref:DUF262 domain-containing protein n=1 Tax=Hahella sp. HNIBRBA332 TaxID=3015983 RepID=UPI00273AC1D2|nr:DUF262 domain-containing protein [Hahella sp. HNIBRBA332]WLQ13309.1 DUF262 domain-containing protein [Hahella sp. HNIBRBA332]